MKTEDKRSFSNQYSLTQKSFPLPLWIHQGHPTPRQNKKIIHKRKKKLAKTHEEAVEVTFLKDVKEETC